MVEYNKSYKGVDCFYFMDLSEKQKENFERLKKMNIRGDHDAKKSYLVRALSNGGLGYEVVRRIESKYGTLDNVRASTKARYIGGYYVLMCEEGIIGVEHNKRKALEKLLKRAEEYLIAVEEADVINSNIPFGDAA